MHRFKKHESYILLMRDKNHLVLIYIYYYTRNTRISNSELCRREIESRVLHHAAQLWLLFLRATVSLRIYFTYIHNMNFSLSDHKMKKKTKPK